MDLFPFIDNEDLDGMRHKIANGGDVNGLIFADMYGDMGDLYAWDYATPLIAVMDHFGDDIRCVSYIEALCIDGGADIDMVS